MRNWTQADLLASDPDALLIASACEMGTTVYSSLANDLNVAMILDDSARARYLAIYGVEWVPVPPIGGESDEIVIELDLSEIDADRLSRAGMRTVR